MSFRYPYNNFLHHQVDNIVGSCLESKRTLLVDHILRDCDLVAKILEAEKHPMLAADSNKVASVCLLCTLKQILLLNFLTG